MEFSIRRDVTAAEDNVVTVRSEDFDEGLVRDGDEVWEEVGIVNEDDAPSVTTPSQICVELKLIGWTMKQPSAIDLQFSISPSPAL